MDIIDFHAHIVPGADHGSTSINVTALQLQSATKHGVKRIVATPHFYPERENPDVFVTRRNSCFDRIARLSNSSDAPSVRLGAEVLICDNIEQMPMLDELCISGTKVLLIELPFSDFSDSYIASVKSLIRKGYTIVLAHADRYNPRNIDKLIVAGAYVQLNADSLLGLFIPRHINKWLRDDRVYALGSDIHGPDNKAYRRFEKAIKRLRVYISSIKTHSDSIWV